MIRAPSKTSGKFEALEGLRGLCASMVVFSHWLKVPGSETFVQKHGLQALAGFFSAVGHPCVWIFFVLSGFVMANRYREPFSGTDFWHYLGRRLLRLWPIMLLAGLVAVAVLGMPPVQVFLGNMGFLQGILVPVMPQNEPLWSLSYEMFYYIFFGLVMWGRWPEWVLPAASGLGVVLAILFSWPVVEILLFTGFWYAGLWLARHRFKAGWLFASCHGTSVLSWVLVLLCLASAYSHANAITTILGLLGCHRSWALGHLILLPLYVAVVALALESRLRGMKWLALAVAGACLVRAAAALRHPDPETLELLAPMAGWLLLALAFAICPLPKSWNLERLEKLGGISYAIYVLHWPTLSLMWLALSWLGYRGTLLFVLLPVAVLLLFALSWFSEHIYQPWWVRHYRRYLMVGH